MVVVEQIIQGEEGEGAGNRGSSSVMEEEAIVGTRRDGLENKGLRCRGRGRGGAEWM